MLQPADAALACRDTQLPGLATVLDAERLAERVRQETGTRIDQPRLLHVRYRPGTSCLVTLQLELHGRAVDVHAKALRRIDRAPLEKSRAAQRPNRSFFGMRIALEPELIDVAIFPADRKLPTLFEFATEPRRREILQRVLAVDPLLSDGRLARLAYQPERRWVGKLTDTRGRHVIVKVYTRAEFERAHAIATKLPHLEGVHVPRLLGRSRRHAVLAFNWCEGAPLTMTAPGSAMDRTTLQRLGAALARLHGHKGARFPARAPELEAAQLLTAAREISVLAPHLGTTAFVLARELGQRLAEAPVKQRALHGDLDPRQILLAEDGRIALLDFGRAASGDPALDLGTLIAHWERDVAGGTLAKAALTARRDALLDGYREHARAIPARIRLYTAAALLRQTPELFARRAPHWSDDMSRALVRCEVLLHRLDDALPRMLEAS